MYGDSDPITQEVQDKIVRYKEKERKDDGKSLKIQGLCLQTDITRYFIGKISLGYSYSTSYQPEDIKKRLF